MQLFELFDCWYYSIVSRSFSNTCRKSTKTNFGIGFFVLFQLLYSTFFLMLLKILISRSSRTSRTLHFSPYEHYLLDSKKLSNLEV